jgi:prevent-host-death family protein
MVRVNVQDAKTHLSRYLHQVEQGEVVILCRHNKPIAEIRPVAASSVRKPRIAGLLRGQIHWEPGTFDPLSDAELREFDGSPIFPTT